MSSEQLAVKARETLKAGGIGGLVTMFKDLLAGGKVSPFQIIQIALSLLSAMKDAQPASLKAPGPGGDGAVAALSPATLQELVNDVTGALSDGKVTLREGLKVASDVLAAAAEAMGEDNDTPAFGFRS